MTIGDWLVPERIQLDVPGETLEEVVLGLLERLPSADSPAPSHRSRTARELAFGERGDVVRILPDFLGVFAEQEGLTRPRAFLAVASGPFSVPAAEGETEAPARGLFLLLVPARLRAFRSRIGPALRRYLESDGLGTRLLNAATVDEVMALPGFLELSFPERARVREAMQEISYRVYPETPVGELVGLMMRRGLHALPVVGEDYEVLGIVTTGDALRYLVPRMKDEPRDDPGVARDVMTRTVLCVSEDQELRDVARLMVNREVEQLPVVREGQLVGFVTRDSILNALFGPRLAQD